MEIGVVVQVNGRAKWHLLRGLGAHTLLDVSAAQGLGGPAFLDHELERVILVDDDLLVLEQLEEAVIGHIFDVVVSAAAEKNGQTDQAQKRWQ